MSDFVKSFLCIHWNDYTILFFNLLIWHITFTDFQILSHFCIPWIKSHLIMMHDPFSALLNSICLYFVEDNFASVFIKDIGHNFLFRGVFVCCRCHCDAGLIDEFRSIPSSANFWCELFFKCFLEFTYNLLLFIANL